MQSPLAKRGENGTIKQQQEEPTNTWVNNWIPEIAQEEV